MERKEYFKALTIVLLLIMGAGNPHAQQSPRETVYRAYVSNHMEDWDRVIVELNRNRNALTGSQQLELVNYYYGYIGWAIGEEMNRKAKNYLSEAEEIVDELLVEFPEMPDLYAYKGAFIGYAIGMNPIKAVILGPESMKNIDYALEIGPDRPQSWIEKGNALFYMPKMFGGSKEIALQNYRKAIQLMENDPEMTSGNWMYLNVLTTLGQSYEKTGDLQRAKATYEKVMQLEPDFTYMRDELYPAFIKKWRSD